MIALLSTGFPTFMIQDAYAAASVFSSATTTSTTTIDYVFDQAIYVDLVGSADFDAQNAFKLNGGSIGAGIASAIVVDEPTGGGCAGGGTLTVEIVLDSAIAADAIPTIQFTNSVVPVLKSCDGAGTDAAADGAAVTPVDGIVPTVVSAATTSSTTIDITFSEDITDVSSDLGDYTINGVAGGSDVLSKSVSGAVITLTTNGYSILHDQTVTVTFDGDAGELTDAAANTAPDFTNQAVTNNVLRLFTSDCYDCTPPTVQEAQITVSSDNYTITSGDESTHITANVGDEISLVLKITDNRSTDTIPFVGLYTDFIETPGDMNLFYTNHYDNLKNISTSFYEWNVRSDDVAYDYDGTVSWSNDVPTVANDPMLGEYFMVPFTMKFTDSMETSQIIVKSSDIAGNHSYESLPVTLEVIGNAPIDFESLGKQKVLGFFDESVLSVMISELNTSDNISTSVSALLGLSDESLPAWTSDLAKWTAEDKITSGDLIVAAEYLINQ